MASELMEMVICHLSFVICHSSFVICHLVRAGFAAKLRKTINISP
ncbi:MAG: hypothetical protein RIG27_11225 [Coleofasciculus sp. F4-SAH-05]